MTLLNAGLILLLVLGFAAGFWLLTRKRDGQRPTTPPARRDAPAPARAHAGARPPEPEAPAYQPVPANAEMLASIARRCLEQGDLERARKGFRSLLLLPLDAGPITKAEVLCYLAEIHERLGEPAKAINMLERAVESDPTLARALEGLARLTSSR